MARTTVDWETAERMVKAGLALPAGTQVYTETEVRGMGGLSGKPDDSVALPRDDFSFGPWAFGPGMPVIPAPISPRRQDGQPYPRRSEYPVSWNLPGTGTQHVPWRVLRQASEVELVRRCIELRKTELAFCDWDILPREDAVSMMAEESGIGTRETQKQLLKEAADDIARVKEFFQRPDRLNDMPFADWLAALLEDHFVYDAMTIYPWRTNDGELHSLVQVDGSSIKPLLDTNGNRPQPPAPAFQQYIYGFPRGEFTDQSDADDEFAATDLVYLPKLRRAWTPYGFGQVEQALVVMDLWLKRQEWIRAEFTAGVMPDGWMKTTKEMKPEQIRQYEIVLNELLAGDTEGRKRIRVLPDGFEPHDTVQFADKFHPTYDEFLIRVVCMCFDVQPMEIGFMPSQGLGGKGLGDAQEDVTYRRSIRPMFRWLTGILNDLAVRYLGMNPVLTFRFMATEEEDETLTSNVRKEEQSTGVLTLNDRRAEKGLSLYEFDEANEPLIITTRGVIPIRGALTAPVTVSPATPTQQPNPGVTPSTGDAGTQANSGDAGQQPADGSGAASKPTAADEAKKFVAFARNRVRDGRWLPFEFGSPLMAVGAELNRIGEQLDLGEIKVATAAAQKAVSAVPKARSRQKMAAWDKARDALAKKRAAEIRKAFAKLIPKLSEAVEAYSFTLQKEAAPKPDPSEVAQAKAALQAVVSQDALTAATSVLEDTWSEGYVTGASEAQVLMGVEPTFDVGNWRAEAKLLGEDGGRGLAGMLDDAGVSIRSIADSRLDVLAKALADGIHNGDPVDVVADDLAGILDDPGWADVVAQGETARAMSQASLDQYRDGGMGGKEWLTADKPCALCEENEAAGPIPLEESFPSGDDTPPGHPNCLCALIPVLVSEMGDSTEP